MKKLLLILAVLLTGCSLPSTEFRGKVVTENDCLDIEWQGVKPQEDAGCTWARDAWGNARELWTGIGYPLATNQQPIIVVTTREEVNRFCGGKGNLIGCYNPITGKDTIKIMLDSPANMRRVAEHEFFHDFGALTHIGADPKHEGVHWRLVY